MPLKMYYLQMLMKLQNPESSLERIRVLKGALPSLLLLLQWLPEERNRDHRNNPRPDPAVFKLGVSPVALRGI